MSSNNAFHLGMELMDGGSLLDSMKRCYKLNAAHTMPPAALATIAVDVLGAEFLHDELQVIHRDVKPGNILLSTSGRAKLGDLGIATEPGEVRVDPLRVCFRPSHPAARLPPSRHRVDRHQDLHIA
jgi:serine/threonine protein kinase